MQRPLEARVRKVLAAGEDWRERHGRGRHAYLLHATRVSRDSRLVIGHCVRVESQCRLECFCLALPCIQCFRVSDR